MAMIETGIKRTENGVFCEKCGNDIGKEGSVEFISHVDGTTAYGYTFACKKCGATITQTIERTKEDAAWWGVDE